jgi:GNAT superfamily N-acetyltransferase
MRSERRASSYVVRQVDGADEFDVLRELQEPFKSTMPIVDTTDGRWWIAYRGRVPVAYLGMIASTHYPNAGYFKRVGVLPEHRGQGLQARLMRVMERAARQSGLDLLVSDTTDNVPSANNFVRSGWLMFSPEFPWSFPQSLYWRKAL